MAVSVLPNHATPDQASRIDAQADTRRFFCGYVCLYLVSCSLSLLRRDSRSKVVAGGEEIQKPCEQPASFLRRRIHHCLASIPSFIARLFVPYQRGEDEEESGKERGISQLVALALHTEVHAIEDRKKERGNMPQTRRTRPCSSSHLPCAPASQAPAAQTPWPTSTQIAIILRA